MTVNREKIKEKQFSPRVRKLRGIIKTDQDVDINKTLAEELLRKYVV